MPGIMLNEDFENFMACHPPEKMSEEGLREQLDHYAAGGAKTVLFCGNGMRAMFDSEAFEPLWKGVEEREDGRIFFKGREVTNAMLPVKDNLKNCKKLYSTVKNPFKTRIDYGRSLGMKIFASMRMNDVHLASTPESPMLSDFWRENPEFRVAPYVKDWHGQALDYARPEVYEHHLALVREYLARFDFDGIELDWMRTPPHFRPGFEQQGLEILSSFMRETRALADAAAKRNGHPVEVSVRVPSAPDGARRDGMDVPRWVDEGLVDRVATTSYWGVTDYDIPLELWRRILGSKATIAAGLEIICRSNPKGSCDLFNTKEIVFGYASSFYHRGADEIYLFNHMDGKCGMRDKAELREVLETVGSPERTAAKTRRHVVSYRDFMAQAYGVGMGNVLPLRPGEDAPIVRLNVGGGTKDRHALLAIGYESASAGYEIRLNGAVCQPSQESFGFQLPKDIANVKTYAIPADALHDGDNVIELVSRQAETAAATWLEIDILS